MGSDGGSRFGEEPKRKAKKYRQATVSELVYTGLSDDCMSKFFFLEWTAHGCYMACQLIHCAKAMCGF